MEETATVLLVLLGAAAALAFGAFAVVSVREGEKRAAKIAWAAGGILGVLFFGAALLPAAVKLSLLALVGAAIALAAVLILLPLGRVAAGADTPQQLVDERDIMFARARLRPGSPEYASYYAMRPENRAGDDLTRSKPGLLSSGSQAFDPFLFAAAEASFDLTEAVRDRVGGPVAATRYDCPPPQMTAFIKGLAKYYGALDAGIARLQPYHVYSHVGRGSGAWGEPVRLDHSCAVAFTVEMDFQMIGANPAAPGVMESARQYVEAARVALQLAGAIRRLGYDARAHIDGNYRVIAPLVARDAGLGEIGRMGLLMTPARGPRVRIGLVTTDLELLPDARRPDPAVVDFCSVCKKCAVNCPSRSIPFDDRQQIDGALRWQIDAETCYRYWRLVGTDCGVCMTVCPYSHPANWAHNMVRRAVSRSGCARRAAYWLDDFFYGRKPSPKPPPPWLARAETSKSGKER